MGGGRRGKGFPRGHVWARWCSRSLTARTGGSGRPRRRLRVGLVQLLCALAGLGLGLVLPRITTDATVASTRVTDALVAAGFGVLGLVTVIFSLLFLVVQWAFTKPFTPAEPVP